MLFSEVSWPDDQGEIKEAPIPEQFQHKIVNGSVTSQVSDLYHWAKESPFWHWTWSLAFNDEIGFLLLYTSTKCGNT